VTDHRTITGLILAGGQGRRMGHADKGLQLLRGVALAGHVLRRLAPQVHSVAISANRNAERYAALGQVPIDVWPDASGADDAHGYAGPLAGLQAALRRCATPLLAVVPCDAPLLAPDLVECLHVAMIAHDADLAVAVTLERDADGSMRRQRHPVFCLVKKTALDQLNAYLATGGRRMDGWYDALRVTEVLFDDARAFCNVNTSDELRELETQTAPTLHELALADGSYNPDALSVADAQRLIAAYTACVVGSERLTLRCALDRVLADDVISPISVPAHDNSAMDGYALRGADLRADAAVTLDVVATVYAGKPSTLAVQAGQCVRIMTGGVMPDGLDTVLPQECAAAIGDGTVTIAPGTVRSGDNRRFKGEDLLAGSAALRQGKPLRPADIGLLASLGLADVAVRRRLRVAFFSTGDELRSAGEPLDAGCVYDSNRYTLRGMLQRLGCDIVDLGVVKDDPAALEAALRSACEQADAVITSGGVAAGAADHGKDIMARLGDVAFWGLNMRPGRSIAFGKISSHGHSAYLFGLPGNPVAVMVTFYFFARAALLRLMGADAALPPLLPVRAAGAIAKKRGRTEYQRGIVSVDALGNRSVRITGAQGSGILRSMSEANCMVVLHEQQGDVAAGDVVDVIAFDGLL